MRTIPDAILERIVTQYPHLRRRVTHLTSLESSDDAPAIERQIATIYLMSGVSRLSALETWHLAQVSHGAPWGGAYVDSATAAARLQVSDSRIRQRIAKEGWARDGRAVKRGKTWYVRRDALEQAQEQEQA